METLNAAIASFDEKHSDHSGELKMTMLTHWASGQATICAHIAPLPPRPPQPVKIQVLSSFEHANFDASCCRRHYQMALQCLSQLFDSINRVFLRSGLCVQIRGQPRANAAAKDSEWVRERQELEATRPDDVNEIVLVNKGAHFNGKMVESLALLL